MGHDLVTVPAGKLIMGSGDRTLDAIAASQHLPRSWFEDETPRHTVHVDAFRIDRHPVTNAQYAAFTEATGYRTVAEQRGFGLVYGAAFWEETQDADWRHPTGHAGAPAAARPDHPVVHIAWPDAHAYATHAGLRLPTEAEWEYAARGPDTERTWPWGQEWDPDRCTTAETPGSATVHDMTSWRSWWAGYRTRHPLPGTTPVGAHPSGASPFGVADLSGNVQEWTDDRYGPYDPARHYGNLYTRITGRYRVIRGGSWMHYRWQSRCAERIAADPLYSNFSTGFRCAADHPDASSPSGGGQR